MIFEEVYFSRHILLTDQILLPNCLRPENGPLTEWRVHPQDSPIEP